MIFLVCLLFLLRMLLSTFAVKLVSVCLALYLHSAPIYGLWYEMKTFTISLCVALQVYLLVDVLTVWSAYYTWSCAHRHIADDFLADEIIWDNLVNHRHQDGTLLNTTVLPFSLCGNSISCSIGNELWFSPPCHFNIHWR